MYQTNYTVDKEKNAVTAERTFAAQLPLVWRAWTEKEILDQWWAPKPWKAETKTLDFRPGGIWLYAMKSPNGEVHWSRVDFSDIVKEQLFTSASVFSDENGTPVPGMNAGNWQVKFKGDGNVTHVTTTLTFETAEDMERLIAMGFKEGFAMGHGNLDEYLQTHTA